MQDPLLPWRSFQMRRVAGAWFLTGFAAAFAGALFFVASQSEDTVFDTAAAQASSILVAAAVVLTLVGLVAFDLILSRAGRRLLPAAATIAYGVATISWVTAQVQGLALHEWTYGLEQVYVVAAGFSMLVYGVAVIQTDAIPRWTGWVAVGWSAAWLIQFVRPHEIYPPLVPQLVPLLFGVVLLSRKGSRAAEDEPGSVVGPILPVGERPV